MLKIVADFARRNGYFVRLKPRTGIILQVLAGILCPLHGGALRPDHGAARGAALVHPDHPDLVPFRAGGLHLHAGPLCAAAQFAIEIGAVTLLERDVALTDFGLTIECLALAG